MLWLGKGAVARHGVGAHYLWPWREPRAWFQSGGMGEEQSGPKAKVRQKHKQKACSTRFASETPGAHLSTQP